MNLRQLFFLTTLAAAAAFLARRPLVAVWEFPGALYWIGQPWQHWAWLVGFDVEYRNPNALKDKLLPVLGIWWGASAVLQVMLLCIAGFWVCDLYRTLGASRLPDDESWPGWRY
jgi:hypothetical protein